MSRIKKDVASWFEWAERIKSGNLGYKTGTRFEPGVITNGKKDPTPNAGMPSHLVLIDSIMHMMPNKHHETLKCKYTHQGTDEDRALTMCVSLTKYYSMVKCAESYLAGCYDMHYCDRRKQKYTPGIEMV